MGRALLAASLSLGSDAEAPPERRVHLSSAVLGRSRFDQVVSTVFQDEFRVFWAVFRVHLVLTFVFT